MTKFLTAYITEIDDMDAAIDELNRQIQKEDLLKNSIAFIAFEHEFLEIGAVSLIAEELGIPYIGFDSIMSFVPGAPDLHCIMSISVLTSDETHFKVECTEEEIYNDDPHRASAEMYGRLMEGETQEPDFILATQAFNAFIGNDTATEIVAAQFKKTVLFGSISLFFEGDKFPSETTVIVNGKEYSNAFAVIGAWGDIECEYYYFAIQENNVIDVEAVVTEAQDNIIKTINYIPLKEFLIKNGIINSNNAQYVHNIPVMVQQHDGYDPIARTIISFLDDGSAYCTAKIPVGSSLSIGELGVDYILRSAEEAAKIANKPGLLGAVFISCATRNIAMGSEIFAEINAVRSNLPENLPYFFAYSGGEIAPVKSKTSNNYVTRLHNNTLILCLLKHKT